MKGWPPSRCGGPPIRAALPLGPDGPDNGRVEAAKYDRGAYAMAITFSCQCGRTIKVRDEFARSPVKCPQCRATVIVPDPRATTPGATGAAGVATTVAIPPTEPDEPWFYKFLVGFSLVVFIFGAIQFALILLTYMGQGSGDGPETTLANVIMSGAVFLSSLFGYALALVLADIGRNVRWMRFKP